MIQIKNIYLIASVLMVVTMIANLYNLTTNWAFMNFASRVSFIFGSILFQTLIAVSFFIFYRITPKMPDVKDLNENPELKSVLNNFSKQFKKEDKKK